MLIASGEETPADCEVLLNLGANARRTSSASSGCSRSCRREDAERQAGRNRYRFYRERGYEITNHDLAARPMSDDDGRDANPLGERVDALLQAHRSRSAPAGEVPVLTEVVDDERAAAPRRSTAPRSKRSRASSSARCWSASGPRSTA